MTSALLNTFPSWLLAIAIVAAMVGLTVALARAMPARWVRDVGEGHNDVAGMMFTTVGVMYALLLAFVVVSTYESINAADAVVTQEGATLQALHRNVTSLPDPFAREVGALVVSYAQTVIDSEWPELAHGRGSEAADEALDALYPPFRAFEPRSAREEIFFALAVEELDAATEERFQRLHAAQAALPGMFWVALIIGALLTQASAALLYMQDRRLHELMLIALAVISGLLLFLVLALDNPFAGDLSVAPDAFRAALEEMRHSTRP